MASKCGEQFRRRYIEGEIERPSGAIISGIALDRSVRANLGRKIETGWLMTPEQAGDVGRDQAARALEDFEPTERDSDYGESAPQIRGAVIDEAVEVSQVHARAIAPNIHPSHVARPFTLDISGYDYQLVGEIDIREDEDGLIGIRDTKRTRKSPEKDAADKSLQLTTYALAEHVENGRPPDYVALDFVRPMKRGTLVDLRRGERTEADFRPLLDRVQVFIEGIQRGVFMPATEETAWWCGPKWCGYYRTCRYVRRPVTSAPLVQIANNGRT